MDDNENDIEGKKLIKGLAYPISEAAMSVITEGLQQVQYEFVEQADHVEGASMQGTMRNFGALIEATVDTAGTIPGMTDEERTAVVEVIQELFNERVEEELKRLKTD